MVINSFAYSVPCAVADGHDSTLKKIYVARLSGGHPLPRIVLNSRCRDLSEAWTLNEGEARLRVIQ